jgi:hypothetical protein
MRKFIIKRLQNVPKIQHQSERDTLDPRPQWIGFCHRWQRICYFYRSQKAYPFQVHYSEY